MSNSIKNPYDEIRELLLNNIRSRRDDTKSNFNQLDNLLVWITGFSIGAISLIISNFSHFNNLYNHCTQRLILLLLITSVICGVIFRIAFYYYQIFYKRIEYIIESKLSEKRLSFLDTDDLEKENSYKEVLRRIKEDFDDDLYYMIDIYEKVDEHHKNILLVDMKKYYGKLRTWTLDVADVSVKVVKEIYKDAFKISNKRVDKLFARKDYGNWYKIFSWISFISFILSCGLFISVLIILCVKY